MIELLPCPFCGETRFSKVNPYPWEKEGEDDLMWGYHVICDASGPDTRQRGCGSSSGWGETQSDAIAAWKRRPVTTASLVTPVVFRQVIDAFEFWKCGDDPEGYNTLADLLAVLMSTHTPTTKYFFDESGKPVQVEWCASVPNDFDAVAACAWDFVRPKLLDLDREKGPAGVWSNGFRSGWTAALPQPLP